MKKKERKTIVRRFLDDIYTREEASQALGYLADPDTSELFDEASSEVWKEASLNRQTLYDDRREKYKKEAHRLLNSIAHKKKRRWLRIASVAASVAMLVATIWGVGWINDTIHEKKQVYLEVRSTYGEKKQLALADGTKVVLNSCSYVRYPKAFTTHQRVIELEGEAYFQVARNESKPFIVKTRQFDVAVLGTSFDVKSYPTDEVVSVSVESGKVEVGMPDAVMRLGAKEHIYINTVTEEYSKYRKERRVAAWIKGSLCFNSTPVRDVAKELERTYNCRINFDENSTYENLISGEHDNKSLESVLESLEYTSNIKYKKKGRDVLLYK